MKSAVCTLFENHFHFGLAALTNSLHKQGFEGAIYAGYRGQVPTWAATAKEDIELKWPGATTCSVTRSIDIHFLPIDTHYHFTNYKPSFMLQLWDGPARHIEALMYLDPDIVINCKWSFFENWVGYGVGLVHEIVLNDMPGTHPVRMQWKNIIEKSGRQVKHNISSYINGGFCGVVKENISFINNWKEFIEMGVTNYNADITKIWSFDKTHPFCFLDQDAMNITAMCSEVPISEIGPEGMDFIHGGWTMAHAVGSPKPWKKNYIKSAFSGNPPTIADKEFWKNVYGPVNIYNAVYIKWKRLCMNAAAFVGRFYRRY